MVTISFGKAKAATHKVEGASLEDVIEKAESIFSMRNLVLIGAGVSLGIMIKQQSDIRVLKRTVEFMQEVIR